MQSACFECLLFRELFFDFDLLFRTRFNFFVKYHILSSVKNYYTSSFIFIHYLQGCRTLERATFISSHNRRWDYEHEISPIIRRLVFSPPHYIEIPIFRKTLILSWNAKTLFYCFQVCLQLLLKDNFIILQSTAQFDSKSMYTSFHLTMDLFEFWFSQRLK